MIGMMSYIYENDDISMIYDFSIAELQVYLQKIEGVFEGSLLEVFSLFF